MKRAIEEATEDEAHRSDHDGHADREPQGP